MDEIKKLNKEKDSIKKSYYDYPESNPLTPYGVTSFSELVQVQKQLEMQSAYELALAQFIEMSDRIIHDVYQPVDEFGQTVDNRIARLKALTKEFIARIEETVYVKDDSNDITTATSITISDDALLTTGNFLYVKNDENLTYTIDSNVNVENNPVEISESKGIKLIKSNDKMLWFGVPTNKFQDTQNQIIPSYAHEEFVKDVNDGKEPWPDLYLWHIKKPIGKTEFLAYDERGFVVAGGVIFEEYEDIVSTMIENMEKDGLVVGMSHGMNPYRTIVRNDIIEKYYTFEFSLLPLKRAANLLTGFTV